MWTRLWMLSLVGLVGCYTQIDQSFVDRFKSPDPVSSPDPELHFSLTLSDDEVSPSAPIEIRVLLRNTSDERIWTATGSAYCLMGCSVMAGDHEFRAYVPKLLTLVMPCFLDPGETYAETLMWEGKIYDQKIHTQSAMPHEKHSGIEDLPHGVYTLVLVAGRFRSEPQTVTVN